MEWIIDAQSRRDTSKEKGKGLPKIPEWDNDENVMKWGIKKVSEDQTKKLILMMIAVRKNINVPALISLKLIIDAQNGRDISKEKGKGLPKIQEWDNDENVMRWVLNKKSVSILQKMS